MEGYFAFEIFSKTGTQHGLQKPCISVQPEFGDNFYELLHRNSLFNSNIYLILVL